MALSKLSTNLGLDLLVKWAGPRLFDFAVNVLSNSKIYKYFFPPLSSAKGTIAVILSPQMATASCIVATFILFLALLHPETRKMLSAAVGGALAGGFVAVAFFSPSTSTVNGANSFAYAGGAAKVIKDAYGIAIAIGEGACAEAVNDVVLAIGPAVATGLTVGGIIGLLAYLVYKFSTSSK